MNVPPPPSLPVPPPWRSSYVLGLSVAVVLAIFLGSYASERKSPASRRSQLCKAVESWRAKYGNGDDLQVLSTRVIFRGIPGKFVPGDAVVLAPAGVDLPGAQAVLEIVGDPAPLRIIKAEGVSTVAWEYPGSLMHDMTFEALSLVRRGSTKPIQLPKAPTFDSLATDVRVDALVSASMLEERHVAECKAFPSWVREKAGDPPYTEQLLRIVRHVGAHLYTPDPVKDKGRSDDACTGIRENRFTQHQAQVLAVMAGRELKAPTLGLQTAARQRGLLVATYVDGPGWIHVPVTAPDPGFTTGGEGIVTKSPFIGRFEAALDDGWNSAAAAFKRSDFMGISPVSYTQVEDEAPDRDSTARWSMPLKDVCP